MKRYPDPGNPLADDDRTGEAVAVIKAVFTEISKWRLRRIERGSPGMDRAVTEWQWERDKERDDSQ